MIKTPCCLAPLLGILRKDDFRDRKTVNEVSTLVKGIFCLISLYMLLIWPYILHFEAYMFIPGKRESQLRPTCKKALISSKTVRYTCLNDLLDVFSLPLRIYSTRKGLFLANILLASRCPT
jgi:hypothetical protein